MNLREQYEKEIGKATRWMFTTVDLELKGAYIDEYVQWLEERCNKHNHLIEAAEKFKNKFNTINEVESKTIDYSQFVIPAKNGLGAMVLMPYNIQGYWNSIMKTKGYEQAKSEKLKEKRRKINL